MKTGDLSLRRMTPEDVPDVARIHVLSFREQDPGAFERASTSLHEDLTRAWAHLWVACRDGLVRGAFVAWVVADEVHLLDVATHPDCRRQGIGRALVHEVLSLARRERGAHVYLEVRRSNAAAIALYRGAGFAAIGLRERYYGDNEDAVEMVAEIDARTGDVVRRDDDVLVSDDDVRQAPG